MKRIISLTLVALLIFAFTISVSAKNSPTPKNYYSIHVSSEGSGTASASTDKVSIGSSDYVVLTATPKDGFFTKWIIGGDYELIDGDEYSTTITIKPKTDINAVASFSVEEDYINVYANAKPENLGDATADPSRIAKGSGDTSTLTATEKNGGVFDHWELNCEYDIVSGSLKSKTLVIRPYTDVYATAYFKTSGGGSTGKDDTTSPKTGDPIVPVVCLMGLALFAAVFATRKIKG